MVMDNDNGNCDVIYLESGASRWLLTGPMDAVYDCQLQCVSEVHLHHLIMVMDGVMILHMVYLDCESLIMTVVTGCC